MLVRAVIERVTPQIDTIITPALAERVSKIFLTGCGDSYYAGLASRLAFDMYAGVATEPVESLEFSRYLAEFMPAGSLVIAVSNSGEVARTVETLAAARNHGGHPLAITGKRDSRLAKAASDIIVQTIPSMGEEWNPYSIGALGLGNYVASLLTLYLIAMRIGKLRGRISEADAEEAKRQITQSAEIIEQTVAANNDALEEYARQLWHLDTFHILGAGPNYASALFSAAKLFEQPHANGVPQELEEWAHEQYFLTRPGITPIFVIVPPGRSRDRALEQIQGAKDMGATVAAVCDADDAAIQAVASISFPIQGTLPEQFSPLTYVVPNQLFATHLHKLRGRPPLIAPYDLERLRSVNYRQIFESRIPDKFA